MATDDLCDVLVVGGGPAGAAAALTIAQAGHRVIVAERKVFPREKTCGDSLTPRAIGLLRTLGVDDVLVPFHRVNGVRVVGQGRAKTKDVPWPSHPTLPDYGVVVPRSELDRLVLDHTIAAGAVLYSGTEATAPIIERGFVRGAMLRDVGTDSSWAVRARYVVVADGANSRFGRSLGTTRAKGWPYATAIRGYWESPQHAEPWLETSFGLHDREGRPLPGYGWVYPLGDGTVNVGVGLLSTAQNFKSISTTQLLSEFVSSASERWGLHPDSPIEEPRGARLPMGGSVGPRSGPTYLVIGDAAGTVNPFSGEGISAAYETGLMAAAAVNEAIAMNDPRALAEYGRRFDDVYGLYFKVGRLYARAIGHPRLLREYSRVAIRNRTLLDWQVRILSNSLRPGEGGSAEAAYRLMARLTRLFPD